MSTEERASGASGGSDEPVVLPIEDSLDLHAFAPRDISSVVDEYLRAAHRRGFAEVRLIHGRGKGVQRAVVHALLAAHPLVQRFRDAPQERGGWGATVVILSPGAGTQPAPQPSAVGPTPAPAGS